MGTNGSFPGGSKVAEA